MQKIPERNIRFQTPDNYNSLSENENETWRAPHHGENESVLGSECLKKYESRIIIGRYDVSVAKKIDQSESVNKPVTKQGLTNIDIDSRIWAPPD